MVHPLQDLFAWFVGAAYSKGRLMLFMKSFAADYHKDKLAESLNGAYSKWKNMVPDDVIIEFKCRQRIFS